MYTPIGDTIKDLLQSSTGGTTVDTKQPVITGAKATVGVGAVVISWKTDEPSSSQVEYGKTNTYGSVTPAQPQDDPTTGQSLGVVDHAINISAASLEQEVTYHYRVKSKDKSGNEAVSDDNKTFTTIKPPE